MPKIQFSGRVFPAGCQVSTAALPGYKVTSESGLEMQCATTIKDNVVTIECEVNRYDRGELANLIMFAFRIARTIMDVVSFSHGVAFTVLLETCIEPGGNHISIFQEDISVKGLCTVFPTTPAISTPIPRKSLSMVLEELSLC